MDFFFKINKRDSTFIRDRGVINGKAAKHLPYTNFETIRNCKKWLDSERGPKHVFVKRGTFLSDIVLFFAKQMKSYFSNITYKGVNSKNYVPNPLVPLSHFLAARTFFCLIYSILLIRNKNLSFLSIKHHIGGGLLLKNMCKIL